MRMFYTPENLQLGSQQHIYVATKDLVLEKE